MTVFTCVVGLTDALKPPSVVNPTVRYVCFVDDAARLSVPPYELVRVPPADRGTDRAVERQARALKIRADHPALGTPDLLLWHDAAFRLDCDPTHVALLSRFDTDRADLVAFAHPHRTQIEDEAAAIARLGYVDAAILRAQVATYRREGFTQTAITSTGFCLRRTTPAMAAFNAAWWAEVDRWGWRDQMSVDYVLWKRGIRVTYIPGHYRRNPYARWFAA